MGRWSCSVEGLCPNPWNSRRKHLVSWDESCCGLPNILGPPRPAPHASSTRTWGWQLPPISSYFSIWLNWNNWFPFLILPPRCIYRGQYNSCLHTVLQTSYFIWEAFHKTQFEASRFLAETPVLQTFIRFILTGNFLTHSFAWLTKRLDTVFQQIWYFVLKWAKCPISCSLTHLGKKSGFNLGVCQLWASVLCFLNFPCNTAISLCFRLRKYLFW